MNRRVVEEFVLLLALESDILSQEEKTMGLYDSIYISDYVLSEFGIRCPNCQQIPRGLNLEFQTKCLHSCMEHYYLKGALMDTRLYRLDKPTDKKFWHEYTKEEIEKYEKHIKRFLPSLDQTGYWTEEAWWPENRVQREMGQFPHQWVNAYAYCSCETWIEVDIKFTDGVVVQIKTNKKEGC
jgi:hypothetical protein